TVMTAEFTIERPRDAFVVVATRARPLRGSVVDASDGEPLVGAGVRVVLPFQLEAAIPYPLDRSQRTSFTATTSADGTFALGEIPALDDVVVVGSAAGHTYVVTHADRDPAVPLRIELPPVSVKDEMLMGQVVDASGVPVAGATVGGGESIRTTDDHGRFGLPLEGIRASEVHGEVVLRAGMRGYRSASFRKPIDGWPSHVVLVLGPPPMSIRGVVRDAGGAPLADIDVHLVDPTVLCIDSYAPVYDEELASGKNPATVTAADGSFEIGGLADRPYTLLACQRSTLEVVRTAPIPAGSNGVVLELPTRSATSALDGVVTGRDGVPIAGATVRVSRELGSVRYLNFGFGLGLPSLDSTSRDDGTFRFDAITAAALSIEVSVHGCNSTSREISVAERGAGRVVVVLERHRSFRIETTRVKTGSIQMLGADGEPRMITSRRANQTVSLAEAPLVDGKTPVLVVGDGATTLCVLDDKRHEVLRVPVAFASGEVTVLRP
ncbi:MAG: carboxypeptidase regulatory-like domain-containing protein, partial [Planctomycetes bacterium]|nr:carboxypeptidase regulatory-like domain-containing protein [Planctomycetota bacterium]